MRKSALIYILSAAMLFNIPTSAYAAVGEPASVTQEAADDIVLVTEDAAQETDALESSEDIQMVQDDRLDADGRRDVEVIFPEDAVFPYKITMTGSEGDVSFTIDYNNQHLLVKPGTYKIKSVRDGNNKKKDSGASLVITQDTDGVELDFTNPNAIEGFSLIGFISSNVGFIILAGIAFLGLKKYCVYNGIGGRR